MEQSVKELMEGETALDFLKSDQADRSGQLDLTDLSGVDPYLNSGATGGVSASTLIAEEEPATGVGEFLTAPLQEDCGVTVHHKRPTSGFEPPWLDPGGSTGGLGCRARACARRASSRAPRALSATRPTAKRKFSISRSIRCMACRYSIRSMSHAISREPIATYIDSYLQPFVKKM
uniref:Uncharacterized protein n=1 Tax=Sphaerodactylus townsendi TaxID=933632 RepID=A0ACB8F902_9SAUR